MRDSALNGFWAKAGHNGTHTDDYFRFLGEQFRNVNSREDALLAMERIWDKLGQGGF